MVRNLKYGIGNAPQAIVEQPIFKGTPLKKWTHNGIVVWENGGLASMIAQSNSGHMIFDLSGDYVKAKFVSGSAQIWSNSKMVFQLSQGSAIQVSNDFINWKWIYLKGSLSSCAVTEWGILYAIYSASHSYTIRHVTIDPDTLTAIDDRVIFDASEMRDLFLGTTISGSATPSLDHFWCRRYYLSYSSNYELELYEYVIEKNADGKEIVTGVIRAAQKDCSPYYGYYGVPKMLSNNRILLYRIMFSYGSQAFMQSVIAPTGKIPMASGFPTKKTFGRWLDEQATHEATEREPFDECRARIKKKVQDSYPRTMLDENVEIQAYSAPPYEPWQYGIGETILQEYDPADLGANFYRASSGSNYPIRSGFLGRDFITTEQGKTVEIQRTNLVFPIYAYNSTDKAWVKTTRSINIYDGYDANKVGSTNYVVSNILPLNEYAVKNEDGTISYDDSPYYCMYFSSLYIAFRHKKDMDKNFMIEIASAGGNWQKLDIPKEWFS